MRAHRTTLTAVTAVAAAVLLVGCATPLPEAPLAEPAAHVLPETDAPNTTCGSSGIVEWAPGGGEPTRQGALEAMLRAQQSILENPENQIGSSPPEDFIVSLEAALRVLPELERNIDAAAPLVVPAVGENGAHLGEFHLMRNGDNYVISMFSICS